MTVNEAAIKVYASALNDLLDECIGEDGKPTTPSRRIVMKSRGLLPEVYVHSFNKPND